VFDGSVAKPDYRTIGPSFGPIHNGPLKASRNLRHDHVAPDQAARAVWIALIVACGTCLSPFFACVTPFAALSALAALKLGRRDAFVVIGLVWLVNQAIGYGFLHYPWTWDSAAWGLAIGGCCGLAVLAAEALSTARPAPLAISLPFMAAFATFEFGLYVAGHVLPGSDGAFGASVVWQIFLVNAVALLALVAISALVKMARTLAWNVSSDRPGALSS
jgi:hypothetical protein